MYVNFIFIALFIGYATGVAPIISFHFGAGNTDELKGLLKRSAVLVMISSFLMFVTAKLLSLPMARLYVGYDAGLFEMTVRAFDVYAFSFLFAGFAIFGSAFFTALNDGLTSALTSFLRTLVFQVAAVLVMPLVWGVDGIWFSGVAAEIMAVVVTLIFLVTKKKKYRYW